MERPAGVALVTGASRGIGRAVATALARDGWDVALLARHAGALEAVVADVAAAGRLSLALTADVRDAAGVRHAVAAAETALGPLTALVNNAGAQRLSPALKVSEEDWDTVVDTNLKGAFLCAQAVGERMVQRGAGAIVNIASAAALIAVEDRAAYGASKAGLVMLTRVLALEWAPAGVRVNAVAPTFVDTELGRQTLNRPGMRQQITGRIPLGRIAQTGDVVEAVRFLLDDRAAGFVTGQVLAVDGGLTLR